MQKGGTRQKLNAEGGREAKKFKNHWSISYFRLYISVVSLLYAILIDVLCYF